MEAWIVAYTAAGLLIAFGIGFLAFAAYLVLLSVASPPLAALLVGIVLLVLGAVALLGIRRATTRDQARHDARRDGDALDDIEDTLQEHVDPALSAWVRRHPARGVATAVLLGLAAGYSPSTRRLLQDIYAGIAAAEPDEPRRR